jgi:hypothetical protein
MLTIRYEDSVQETIGTDDSWYLMSAFLLRLAGLPYEASLGLAFPKTAEWARSAFDADRGVAAQGMAVNLLLEMHIGDIDPRDPERVHLINLRRDLFNGRLPRRASMQSAERSLGTEGLGAVREWIARHEERDRLIATGPGVLADELSPKREFLKKLAAEETLRSAILLQSPVLDVQMEPYLNKSGQLDKGDRRAERSILEFVYRASCKTSPFSTLASLGFGEFATDGNPALVPTSISVENRSRIQLNMAILGRLSRLIVDSSDLRRDLSVRMVSGWALMLEQLRYVRRSVIPMQDDDSPIAVDTVHEHLFNLPSGVTMNSILELLPAGEDRVFSALAASLHERNGQNSRDEVERYLAQLLRLGVLVTPATQVDIHASDPLLEFERGVRSIDADWAIRLADNLATVRNLIKEYEAGTVKRRRATLSDLRHLMVWIYESLSEDPGTPSKTLLYEDCFIAGEGLVGNRQTWEREFIEDLKAITTVLPAFDVNLPRRLLTRKYFRNRYGSDGKCDDFQGFAHEFHRDFLQPFNERMAMRRSVTPDNTLTRLESGMRHAELGAIDNARAAAAQQVIQAWSDPHAKEIKLTRPFVDAVVRELPSHEMPIHPWAFFAQLAPKSQGAEHDLLVVNQIFSGLTLMFSRFAHGLTTPSGQRASEVLARELKLATPRGTVLAELSGGYDTANLNMHPPVTPYLILCPGEVSARPIDEQIPIDNLVVVDDPEERRLKLMSRRLELEVLPVYLGFLLPIALPEVQQVLLGFSPQGMAGVDLWLGTGYLPDTTRVTSRPRITYGNVVLQRRCWTIPHGCFPRRSPKETDADYFRLVNRWRLEQNLPRNVFAKVDFDRTSAQSRTPAETEENGDKAGKAAGFSRKPLAVDFDSWFSIVLLEHLERVSKSALLFVEALPGPDQLWARDSEGRQYVSEFVIELYRSKHGSSD